MITINIPEKVYGIELSEVEIVEYSKDYFSSFPNNDCSLEIVYVLSKNGIRVGNHGVRYLNKTDKDFDEEILKGFFTDWFSSINNNV
tara:strand:- start:261 stop:521 length:261 start_codon:yes stop_codon:yes gene_type:complete